MKKTFRIVAVFFLLAYVLTGCTIKSGKETQKAETEAGEIYLKKLEVYSCAVNSEQIYHVSYPYYYYAFDTDADGKRGTRLFDLTAPVSPEELTGQENGTEYFVNYVRNMPENQKGGDLACYVICRYADEEGNEESIYRRSYDVFPEGWEEFIDCCNQICGGEYLTGTGQLQTVTPEFLTEVFGVTDEDVREGTLQDVIDLLELDMREVTKTFRITEVLNQYYAQEKEPLIEPYRPKELVSVNSTQEEYDAFLEGFLEKIGSERVTEEESDQDYFRRFVVTDTGKSFYTARTADMENLPTAKRSTGDYYYMELDAHMEDMVMGVDFIYSADKKYILISVENDPDMMTAFCE